MQRRVAVCFALVICANVLTAFACEFNTGSGKAICSSVADLRASGLQREWKYLGLVGSPGNENFETIPANLFALVPQLENIDLRAMAGKLETGAFNGLNRIFQLHFDDNKMGVLSGQPFSDIPVHWIYMFNCGITDIKPRVFHSLPSLTKVDIQGNVLPVIKEGIFTDLKIIELILRKNKVKQIKPNAFGNMVNLRVLAIELNELTSFEPQFALGYTPSLKDLIIHRNHLTSLTRDMFSVLPNLNVILAYLNDIQHLDDYTFNDLRKMTTLDLSNNHLEELQPNLFADSTNDLKVLLLHNNNLTFLQNTTLDRLPALNRLSTGGNPWQCPCLNLLNNYLHTHDITNICSDSYMQGSRPYCVLSDVYKQECIYDSESVKDLLTIFHTTLSDYTQLPPVCHYSDNVPFLSS